MQLKFDITHPLDAPPEQAWKVLQDMELVAQCMPGASITEQIIDTQYKGSVSVRVGPVQSSFGGVIDITEIDQAAHTMVLTAKGSDSRGSSNATMLLNVAVAPKQGGCELIGRSDIKVMGKMANFGSRMIKGVADQLIKQFLDNFTTQVAAMGEGQEAEQAAEKLAEQPRDINGLTLVWSMLVGFFRRLFGRKETP